MQLPGISLLLIALLLSACDGGGGGGGVKLGPVVNTRLTIDTPARDGTTYYTTSESVRLAGDTFVYPKNANCNTIQPQPINITWQNNANGSSGTDTGGTGCLCDLFACIPYPRWSISTGVIPLEPGSNRIRITGRSPGKSQNASITIVREEAPATINFTNTPTKIAIGEDFELEVIVEDGFGRPIPDQVVDWLSSDTTVADVVPYNQPTNQQGKTTATVAGLIPGPVSITAGVKAIDIASVADIEIIEAAPPPFDPDPPGEDLPGKPELLMPVPNAVISQEPPDACGDPPPYEWGYEIYFDWTDVMAPNGIAGYRVYVQAATATLPLIDEFVEVSEFLHVSCGSFVIDRNLQGWRWWVQAVDHLDQGGPSSEAGHFEFAPCRVADGTPCSIAAQR